MRVRTIPTASLMLALASSAVLAQQTPPIRVRGSLVLSAIATTCPNRSTILVWLHTLPPSNALDFAVQIGDSGVVLNPIARPDSVGRFELRVPASFVSADRRAYLAVSCMVVRGAGQVHSERLPLQNVETRVAVITLPRTGSLDVGRIATPGP